MARSGEHRMLFDLRGRRKRVVQVVYAGLALLIALSLFTVVGSANVLNLFGGGSSGSPSSVFDSQAAAIEKKLRRDPNNAQLLAREVRVRYSAGSSQVQVDPNTGATSVTQSAIDDFSKAADAWRRYLKVNSGKPDPSLATLAVQALTGTVTAGTPVVDIADNLKAAVGAQKIVTDANPSLGSYATLAQIAYFAGDTATAGQAGRKALQASPKSKQSAVKQALSQYKQSGAQLQKQIKAAQKQVAKGGKQALQNPFGGLSGGGSGLSGGSGLTP